MSLLDLISHHMKDLAYQWICQSLICFQIVLYLVMVKARSDGSIWSNQNQFSPMIVEVSVGDTDPGEYFMKGPTDLVSLWSFTSHPFTGHQQSGLKNHWSTQFSLTTVQSMIFNQLYTCDTKYINI